ncbi:MAG TPA: hypothetical protein VL282_15270 [Tepidisphaeraceae bacterium]|nr:hypothetical protein [Tepidisphaeraceae bacterium]
MILHALLAQYVWHPFLNQPPIWDRWYLLLLPLCAGIAIAYKSVKCHSMKQMPWEATVIFFWVLIGMGTAGTILALIVNWQ